MSKLILGDIANLQNEASVVTQINGNNTLIEDAIENSLSRDGSSPNQMGANLDMNSNRILNLTAPANINEPLRLKDLQSFVGGALNLTVITNADVKVTDAPFNAACDGVTNDTVAVQAALNSGNKKIVIPPGKTCLVTGVTVPANTTFQIQEGSTLKKFGTGGAKLVTTTASNVTLLGPGSIDANNTSASACEPIFINGTSSTVANVIVDGLTIKNSSFYGIHCEDTTKVTIKNCYFSGITAVTEYSGIAFFNSNKPGSNFIIDNNYMDASTDATTFVFFLPGTGFPVTNAIITRNMHLGPSGGDATSTEHSTVLLLQTNPLPDVYFQNCIVAHNTSINFNFPYSLTGMRGCSVIGNVAENGSEGYCYEFANCIDCVFSGNYGEGEFVAGGTPFVLNNCFNCTLTSNSAVSSWANAAAVAISALTGSKNIISNNTVKVAGGVGISVTGNDYVISGNMLDGASAGSSAINLNTGSRRTVVNNITKDWTSTPIVNTSTTDTYFGNTTLGAVFTGSISGLSGAEMRLNGGAGADNAVTTIGTGTPRLFFDHRGTSNTGDWLWRNGTAAASTQMSLSGVGVLSVTGNITSTGTGIGYTTGAGGTVTQATNKSTGVTLNKASGNVVMNNAALNAGVSVAFTLTNSTIAATDTVIVNIKSGATANSYTVSVDAVAAGSCNISLRNYTGGNLSEAVVISFNVIKGVAA